MRYQSSFIVWTYWLAGRFGDPEACTASYKTSGAEEGFFLGRKNGRHTAYVGVG